jgi:hypothetical protein
VLKDWHGFPQMFPKECQRRNISGISIIIIMFAVSLA